MEVENDSYCKHPMQAVLVVTLTKYFYSCAGLFWIVLQPHSWHLQLCPQELKMNLMVVESESKKECTAFEWVNENLQDLACVSFPLALPSPYPGALWNSRAPVPCQAGNPSRAWSYGFLLRICSRRLPVVWLNSFRYIARQHLCNSSVSGVGQWPFKCWQGGTEQKFTSEIIHFWWGK